MPPTHRAISGAQRRAKRAVRSVASLIRLLPRQLHAAGDARRVLVLHDQFVAVQADQPLHVMPGVIDTAAATAGVDVQGYRFVARIDAVSAEIGDAHLLAVADNDDR